MSPNVKIKAFKETAKEYPEYLEHIKEIDEKLKMFLSKAEAVCVTSESQQSAAELSEIIELLNKDRLYYMDLAQWVHSVIDSIESSAIKALVWMTYIQHKSFSEISERFKISNDNLYKKRRKYLLKALDEAAMAKLAEIRSEKI